MSDDEIYEASRKSIFWMIAGFVIVIIVFAYGFVLSGYTGKLTHISPQLRAEFIALRFANIPECFAYQDPVNGRVYPKVIDLMKFHPQQMDRCYFTDPEEGYKDYNFRLELVGQNISLASNNYFHQDDFILSKKVQVRKNDGTLAEDILNIKVQTIVGKYQKEVVS
jgi:hypothetical protein